ncbi:hypothetical protein FS749_008268 [Ceratobasidium sp. UAMH 11750]|nr:hypothetical protein FS749_008268 [Ceratobasidium sp. UAMH 11750]
MLLEHHGGQAGIDKAVAYLESALELTPDGHSDKPGVLCTLGNAHAVAFDHLGRLDDINKAIHHLGQGLALTPVDHKYRLGRLDRLGSAHHMRFERLNALDDINKAIGYLDEAVILTPDDDPDRIPSLNNLGNAYHSRFERLGVQVDIQKATECKKDAVALTPDSDPGKPERLQNLGNAYYSLFDRFGRPEDIYKAADFLKQAVALTPDKLGGVSSNLLSNLGIACLSLFRCFNRLEDMDDAVSYLDKSVKLTPDDHPSKPERLCQLGGAYSVLFERLNELDHIDKAVSCLDQAATLASDDHPHKPGFLGHLGNACNLRFKRLGTLDDIEKAVKCREQAVALTPDGHPDKPGQLSGLGIVYISRFHTLARKADLDEAITCFYQATVQTPDDHPGNSEYLYNLGNAYHVLYESSHRLDDLSMAASFHNQAVVITPDDHPTKATLLRQLGAIYFWLSQKSKSHKDSTRALELFKQAALMKSGPSAVRFRASNTWARVASLLKHSPLEGYMCAIELLPQIVWLGKSMQSRYKSLITEVRSTIIDATTAAIVRQKYGLAIEWLEQGRCVVWSQLLELRTPFDELHKAHPEIARELHHISHLLESTSMSQPDLQAANLGGTSLFKVAHKHRRLAEQREQLIDSIRRLDGFENFLRPLQWSTLAGHVRDGFVVIVNVNEVRCNALVIQSNTQRITPIPLTAFTYQKAVDARDGLEKWLRPQASRSIVWMVEDQSQTSIQDILGILWYDIVKHVVEHLDITHAQPHTSDLPHITWYLTGPLSFLPLHAAGDYSSPDTILSSLAISSYTPNLTSLGRPVPTSNFFSGILAVGCGSSTRGLGTLPGTTTELDQLEKQFTGLKCTRLSEKDACSDTVLQAMVDHSWVHFACHASQNPLDPLRSALHLYDSDLDLASISRNPMKHAQLAFLSACQTAAGDSTLPDEAVHLAAGLLMAGYPTVIATMWSIHDTDAPLVSGKFYECLLEGGMPNSRKAAMALHKATAHLRATIGVEQFARWVPYIHVGC